MSFSEIKRREIKLYVLRKIDDDDRDFVNKTADAFGISVTSVKRYIDSELAACHIKKDSDKRCGHSLCTRERRLVYDISSVSEREDAVLFEDILPLIDVNDNARHIWSYVLPEMFNNALEHSEGDKVDVYVRTNCLYCNITVVDNGIGIFKKVTDAMASYGYRDPRPEDAVTELYKGKFTSCPDRHTGEGIFFTMRMLDKLAIISGGMLLRTGYSNEPSYVRSHLLAYAMKLTGKGTVVDMRLENDTRREAAEVFREYSDADDGFYRSRIPVFEACLDHDPVARSQARRICARLSDFKEVVLDFDKVEMMGQGFADELFRVYHNVHPEVRLTPVNMTGDVQMMYMHVINNRIRVPEYQG